jgi:hypothetical protein
MTPSTGTVNRLHRRYDPIHSQRINGYENHAHCCREKHVDEGRNESLYIVASFLQFTKGLATALIFEDLVRQRQRPLNAIRIQLGIVCITKRVSGCSGIVCQRWL